MDWYWICLIIYGATTLLFSLVICSEAPNLKQSLDNSLNPIGVYNEWDVNIFGCILLTVLVHLLIPWIAPFYWLYKLCTVGRR